MKRITTVVAIMVLAVAVAMAQAPEKFSYQAVVRNASNALVTNAPVGVRVSILQGSATGNAVYVETQTATTNANGLLTLEIGGGIVQQGSFADIDWANGTYFLKTETDPAGGSSYSVISTQQLLSVPYALYSKEAGNGFSGDYNDLTNKPTIPTVPTNVSAFNNDSYYITEAQLNALLAALNNTIDSLRNRIEDLESNSPTHSVGLPTVITTIISNITGSTAQCGGDITTYGGSSITERGVCWSISPLPTVSENHTSDGAGIGTFVSYLYGLQPGVTYYVRAYATNSTGTAYGCEMSFTTPALFTCGTGTVTDYDGNVYPTVQIGNQCWMKENLRSTHYADGTAISLGSGNSSTVAYYYPETESFNYGNLYNWKAVMGEFTSSSAAPSGVQGICPNGWHVPSDAEWTQLTYFVSSQSNYLCSNNTEYIAKALASTTGWNADYSQCSVGNMQNCNDATGFGALPAGGYFNIGYYASGVNANYWSSTAYVGGDAWYRHLNHIEARVYRLNNNVNIGYSVRCLRD